MPVTCLTPPKSEDERGWFCETYNARQLAERRINTVFLQDNHSLSRLPGTLRGLHFQAPPHAQAKLIRCVRGSIWDVAVDLRAGSPSYGKWVAVTLSAENGRQIYVPEGFAHGFVTLDPDSEVIYKVSDYYVPECDGGIAWDDATLALPWPLPTKKPILSAKDCHHPTLAEFISPFHYDGRPLEPLNV